MPKFVVQEHFAERAGHHYDLRLEMDGVAKSWALRYLPLKEGERRLAIQTEDHAVEYMDFEGVIPFGYGKGRVLIWDKGEYELLERSEDKIKFKAMGNRFRGYFVLIRYPKVKNGWLLIKYAGGGI